MRRRVASLPLYWRVFATNAAVLFLAQEEGEFEAENLNVSIETIASNDAWPMLAQGQVDAVWSGPEAAFMNLIDQGFDLKWVMGNYSPSPESKTGLWTGSSSGITSRRLAMPVLRSCGPAASVPARAKSNPAPRTKSR